MPPDGDRVPRLLQTNTEMPLVIAGIREKTTQFPLAVQLLPEQIRRFRDERKIGIPSRYDRRVGGPIDSATIPTDATIGIGIVLDCHAIDRDRFVAQSVKPMSYAGREIEYAGVLIGQLKRLMFPESPLIASQVYDGV
jgi:hypothetical protein